MDILIKSLSLQIPKCDTTQPAEPVKKLGIGVDGGFQCGSEADKVENSYKIFVRSLDQAVDLLNATLPEAIRACAESIKVKRKRKYSSC